VLYMSDIALYSVCLDILSQWSVLKIGVMWGLGGVNNSTGERILNSLVAVHLGNVCVREKRILIV